MKLIQLIVLLIPLLSYAQEQGPQPPEQAVANTELLQELDSSNQDASESEVSKNGLGAPNQNGKFKANNQQHLGGYNSVEIENKLKTRNKDPFMLPNDVYAILKKKLSEVGGEGIVDESVHPKWRWALKYYKLVAVIWNVDNPKAMIYDKERSMHMYLVGEKIGNRGAVITSIGSGEVLVNQEGNTVKLRMTGGGEKK